MIVEPNDGKKDMELVVERDNSSKVVFVDTRKMFFEETSGVAQFKLIYIYIRQHV